MLPDGKVLVAGGKIPEHWLKSVRLYDPTTNVWSPTGDLNKARDNHTATLLSDGKVLVAGGFKYPGFENASSELYDPATGTWANTRSASATAACCSLATPRKSHTATLLADGMVLVAGGADRTGIIASAEIYDPALEDWMLTGSLNTARYYHTGTLLPIGKVLVAGGADNSTLLASAELYEPGIQSPNVDRQDTAQNPGN